MPPPLVLPAVLGWSNPEPAPEQYRLYGLDAGAGPRWLTSPFGRVVEQSIREAEQPTYEGDRFLVVHLGNRHVTDERVADLTEKITALLAEET